MVHSLFISHKAGTLGTSNHCTVAHINGVLEGPKYEEIVPNRFDGLQLVSS